MLMSVLLAEPLRTNGPKRCSHEPLTIAAGLAVAQGIEDAAGLDCRLKWPNDALVDGGKLGGVLVEVRTIGGAKWAVIGIGINANAHPPAGQVDFPATSVAEHTGGAANRLEIVRAVMRRLDQWLADLPAINSEEWLAGLSAASLAACASRSRISTRFLGGSAL